MNTKLLSISLTLPVLMFGAGQTLATLKVTNQGNLQSATPTSRISQVRLGTQEPPTFLLTARDEGKQECVWLGICKEK